jgi:hypothetical protein
VIRYEQAAPIVGEQLVIGEMTEAYFILCMERAFGDFPLTLTKDNIERLQGMASCWAQTSINPYLTLIQTIKRLGSIRLWVGPGFIESRVASDWPKDPLLENDDH